MAWRELRRHSPMLKSIWARLAASILIAALISGAGLVHWASHEQKSIAIEQAKYFAESIHQMTLAGLTGMMITGTIASRSLFLEQIAEMHDVKSLRVLRADAVIAQFGAGMDSETGGDELDRDVLGSGIPRFEILSGTEGNSLRAVIPALARTNYLGKDCTNCHQVKPGTVLGAVSMEISLARVDQTVQAFTRDATLAGLAISVPLALFIWLFISRIVTRPIQKMTEGLERIAADDAGDARQLPIERQDEIGKATDAFNRVMAKVGELLAQQRLSRIVFENSLESIAVTDAKNRIQMVNKAFSDTTGYAPEEVIGKSPSVLKSGKQTPEFYEEFWTTLEAKGEWRGEIWNRRKNGSIYPEWLNVSAVRNARGDVEHFVAIFADITERKEREELVTYQAFHDVLTGLPNRLLFRDRLDQALSHAKRHKERAPALMFLDLDRFKQINDTLGHDAGDQLLKEVAARLRRCVRASDTVARLAGDEFTILLPECTSSAGALEVAEKVLAAMQVPINLGAESRVITTSIGISLAPRDANDADTLIKNADIAMYQVKAKGRAGYCFFGDTMSDHPSRRTEMERRLRDVIARRAFGLSYVPIHDLRNGDAIAMQVDLSWDVESGNDPVDHEYIQLAEEIGLMHELGAWRLEKACLQAEAWQRSNAPRTVAVPLTATELQRGDLYETVRVALRRAGLSPALLWLSIPEALLMHDIEQSKRTLKALTALGVRLVVSAFGAGRSHLPSLAQMPIAALQIDQALLRAATQGEVAESALRGLIALGHAIGIGTIAGQCDSDAQLEAARKTVDRADGHARRGP